MLKKSLTSKYKKVKVCETVSLLIGYATYIRFRARKADNKDINIFPTNEFIRSM